MQPSTKNTSDSKTLSFDEGHMVVQAYLDGSFGLFLLCKHNDCFVTVSKVPITNSESCKSFFPVPEWLVEWYFADKFKIWRFERRRNKNHHSVTGGSDYAHSQKK